MAVFPLLINETVTQRRVGYLGVVEKFIIVSLKVHKSIIYNFNKKSFIIIIYKNSPGLHSLGRGFYKIFVNNYRVGLKIGNVLK